MVNIVNVTPHEIRFRGKDGTDFIVQPCGTVISAKVAEEPVATKDGVVFVTAKFSGDEEADKALQEVRANNPGAIVVGSIIAAQAFPGRVFALTPFPGFERVPVSERVMNANKFTTF